MKTPGKLINVVSIDEPRTVDSPRGAEKKVFLKLSGHPTELWTQIFTDSTIVKQVPAWPKMVVDGDCVIVDCALSQFRQGLLDGIKRVVEETNRIYVGVLHGKRTLEDIQARERNSKVEKIRLVASQLSF